MEIREDGILILVYKDETWGSYRHWQVVESVRHVASEEEAEKLINDRENDGFAVCWDLEEKLEYEFNDSSKNRHRLGRWLFKTEPGLLYLVKRWEKNHPSGNRRKWSSGFVYSLVKDGKIVKEWDLRVPGR